MNSFRVKIVGGVPGDALKVLSTLDRTHSLSASTDERVVCGSRDVTVLRNNHESATAALQLTGLVMQDGSLIFRPSRQQIFRLWEGREIDLQLGPGEACTIHAEHALDARTEK